MCENVKSFVRVVSFDLTKNVGYGIHPKDGRLYIGDKRELLRQGVCLSAVDKQCPPYESQYDQVVGGCPDFDDEQHWPDPIDM